MKSPTHLNHYRWLCSQGRALRHTHTDGSCAWIHHGCVHARAHTHTHAHSIHMHVPVCLFPPPVLPQSALKHAPLPRIPGQPEAKVQDRDWGGGREDRASEREGVGPWSSCPTCRLRRSAVFQEVGRTLPALHGCFFLRPEALPLTLIQHLAPTWLSFSSASLPDVCHLLLTRCRVRSRPLLRGPGVLCAKGRRSPLAKV